MKDRKPKVAVLERNEYYEKISAGLGILQVVLFLALFAFVVLSFFRNTDLITYRNFYYFFKDLNASAESVDVFASDSVSYPTSDEQSFTLYRQGLAVAGNGSVTVFTATGRQTVSETIQYHTPTAVGAGKYLLVYEMGGMQYSLYNSYTQIFSGKTDFPIYGAAASDSGMYALLTRSEEYTSVVSLYDSNFKLINRYSKNGYVTDVAIHEKGSRIAIPVTESADGVLRTTLTLYEPRKSDSGITVELGNSLPLSCAFTQNGGVSLLSTDGVRFVSSNGKSVTERLFDGRAIACASLDSEGAVIALRAPDAAGQNEVLVYGQNGELQLSHRTEELPEQIARAENAVFYLTRRGIVRLDVKSGEADLYACHTDHKQLLAVGGDEVLLCSPQKADYIRFS